MNTTINTRTWITRIFFVTLYVSLSFPHIQEIFFSLWAVIISALGVFSSIKAHQSKHTFIAIFFLVLHMSLELPHMMEQFSDGGIYVLVLHSPHVIVDLILLFSLSQSIKYFVLFLVSIRIFSLGVAELPGAISPFINAFAFGGVLGCMGICFSFKKIIKKPAL